MAIKSILVSALAGLIVAALLVAADDATPNELRKVDPSNQQQHQQQQQQQQQQQRPSQLEQLDVTPTSNDDRRTPSGQQQQQQQDNQLVPSGDNSNYDDSNSEDSVFPFDPLGIFEPVPRPDRPYRGNGGQGLFGFFRDPLRHFERHREMMDQQFRQLEKQAIEGQSTSYFTRNGVGYKKVCTIERIGREDQQQQQQQQ